MNFKWTRKSAKLAGLCLGLFLSLPSFAGVILSPFAVNTSISGSGGEQNTIDQTGLSVAFTSGITDFSSYIAGEPTHVFNGPGDSWAAPVGNLPGNLDFDLGGYYSVAQTALWTSKSGFGINNFDIFIASFADFSDAILIGSFSAIETPHPFGLGVQVFDTLAAGRYVRLGVNSNHGQGAIGVNMGEIAFSVEAISAPAPFALILIGIALFIPYARAKSL